VPVYNPTVVYGSWWWPHYTPWYYYPPGYAFGSAIVRGIGFGIGIAITDALWGGCHWGRGHARVDININRYNNININRNRIKVNSKTANWRHDPEQRRGVPYRDRNTRQQFEKRLDGAEERREFRGRDAQRDQARAALDRRGIDPAEGRKQLEGAGGDRVRESVARTDRGFTQGKPDRDASRTPARDKPAGRDGDRVSREASRDLNRERPGNTGQARDVARPREQADNRSGTRDHALSGAGNAQRERQSIARGTSSIRSMDSGGGRLGGGGGGGGRLGGGGGGGAGLRR
jgi:hypothetical protein